ncbi:dynein beta chain, ciliary-like [Arctopsyche grandis]|uniref:dynein beta chain, ciliary-like n=1 Tax=Arctopsyche grandis TaxID=121162 RepID=UPI00406D663F
MVDAYNPDRLSGLYMSSVHRDKVNCNKKYFMDKIVDIIPFITSVLSVRSPYKYATIINTLVVQDVEAEERNKQKLIAMNELDAKTDFMSNFVLKVLRLKPEKWQKMMQGEERNIVQKYIENADIPLITFNVSHIGFLQANFGFSSVPRSKFAYFVRKPRHVITKENAKSILLAGQISNQVVSELTVFTEEIIYPLLCNPKNHKNWPRIIIDDIKKHAYDFKNTLYQIRGELSNQVMLPMPDGIEKLDEVESLLIKSNGEIVDVYLKTNIEGIVILWTTQINNLLKEDSDVVFSKKRFPLPVDDVDFWSTRLKNLEGVYAQLRHPRVKKMANYLELTNSVYLQCFKTMLTSLVAGVVETRDIVIHQMPLLKQFETFLNTNFLESQHLIRPMIHCIGLLWANSRYYRKTERITVLMKEMCNMIVQQSTACCEQRSMFFGEPFEQVLKLSQVLENIEHFLNVYEKNKKNIGSFFAADCIPIHWTFDYDSVFMKLLQFIERLKMAKTILQNTAEMLKLEKVEFGGIRGKIYSAKTTDIYEKYTKLFNDICNIQYDPLDTEDESFKEDYRRFMVKVIDIDRCLAKVFGDAFDDCSHLDNIFKLLQVIGDLANRPRILKELQPRYERLIDLLDGELIQVKQICEEGMIVYYNTKRRPMIDAYFPPVAGMLWWIFKLQQRVQIPMNEFNQIEDLYAIYFGTLIFSSSSDDLRVKYDVLIKRLNCIENELYDEWFVTVPQLCKRNTKKSLLIREKSLLKLNFSHELVCLLREVRYLILLDKFTIPQEGIELYDRSEELQSAICKLNLSIIWYNDIRKDSHESEVTLIENEIKEVDVLLRKGIDELNWNTNVTAYVEEVFDMIDKLQKRVLTAQKNVKQTFQQMDSWANVAMYDRHPHPKIGKYPLLALDENNSRKLKRFEDIRTTQKEIIHKLKENYFLYFKVHQEDNQKSKGFGKASQDENSEENFALINWPAYVDYIDSQVSSAILKAIIISLTSLYTNIDAIRGPNIPFVEVLAELQEPDITFKPPLDQNETESLYSIFSIMIDEIIEQAETYERITKDINLNNYLMEAKNDKQILTMKTKIQDIVSNTIEDIHKYIAVYESYSYLWLDDKQEFLYVFLKTSNVITKDVLEASEYDDIDDDEPIIRPPLAVFKEQIDVFENLYKECDKLPETRLFNGWLLLDMKRLKQSLLNAICKWGNVFKQNIVDYVENRLNDLDEFIEQASKSLCSDLKDNDYEGLLCVMGCLIKVRERQVNSTQAMFEPISEQIELLKTYGVEFLEESYDQDGKKKHSVYTLLEVLPEKWKNLLKLSSVVKSNVGPLKINQAHLISKQVTLFNARMQSYRDEFKYKKFFSLKCEEVYSLIDKTHLELIRGPF